MSTLTALRIIKEVAEKHDVTPEDILGVRKPRHIAAARTEAISAVYRARPDWSLRRIGFFFNRDHKWIGKALRMTGDIA